MGQQKTLLDCSLSPAVREIELLVKRPDAVVGRMLGRTRYAVQLKRHSLGIPQCCENRRAWTPAEHAQLGTMRDVELAGKLKRSVSSVRSRRNDNTSIRFIRTPKRWTPSELRLLGRWPDAEIGRLSRTLFGVGAEQTCSAWHSAFCAKALTGIARFSIAAKTVPTSRCRHPCLPKPEDFSEKSEDYRKIRIPVISA